jgi:hypothetical protein
MKTLSVILIFIFLSFPSVISAKDYNRGKLPQIANPAWVYPQNRKYYKGYEKKKDKVQNNQDWKHHTNRDTGKNRGGGSLHYYDYRSVRQRTSGK